MKRLPFALLLLALAFAATTFALTREDARAAGGPCNTANAGVTASEGQLFSQINTWRAGKGLPAMTLSAPVNAAAQWFAEAMVANGLTGGHTDQFGRSWEERLIDCGYPAQLVGWGSGEALAPFLSGAGSVPDAFTAITTARAGQQNGVQAPAPWECGGVGYAANPNGTVKHAWVVVVTSAPSSAQCPQAVSPGASATATTTATSTATNTPTPTKTPTPSPTPSPTPTLRADGAKITLYSGWNLVTLPPGDIEQLLYRAKGCYRTVYQRQGDGWLRFGDDLPGYVRTLGTSNGGTFWIEGTAGNCGLIPL